MSFEFLDRSAAGTAVENLLPGRPAPYVLSKGEGEGEHSMLFTDLFNVLLSGDETDGQFGVITSDCPTGDIIPTHSHNETHETFFLLEGKLRLYFVDIDGTRTSTLLTLGDFGYVPAGTPHAYKIDRAARILGVMTGGFERFFQHMAPLQTNPPSNNRHSSRTSRGCKPLPTNTTSSSCRTSNGRNPIRSTDLNAPVQHLP